MGPIDETKAAFKGPTSLEELEITGSTELTCLPEGVLQPTLQKISIHRCPKLKMLNPIDESDAAFNGLTSLQVLAIYDCPELITLPAWVLQPTLIHIDIRRCPKLKMLDPIDKMAATFNNLTSLRRLWIYDCPELTIQEAAFKGSSSLEELTICGFTGLTCLPEGVLQPTLLKINIHRCPKLKTLNPIDESKAVFNGFTSLQRLVIIDCPELITLPAWVLQPTLIDIDIRRCQKLKMLNPIDKIATAFNGLTSLRQLCICDCPELTLPAFKGSTSLEELEIEGCTELTCLPEGVLQPTLRKIDIRMCPKLKTLTPIDESKAAFNGSMCLQELLIYDCPELITLPAWVLQPTLIDIDIERCQKLKMLNPIDKIATTFNGLTSLRQLCICDCPELTLPGLISKSVGKRMERVIHDCNPKHHHELELKSYNKPFKCNRCREDGFTSGYRCKHCIYDLHKGCLNPKRKITHDLFPGSIFEFGQERPRTICDACEMEIHGHSYSCREDNLDLHPACSKLPGKLRISGTDFVLCEKVKYKCFWCKKEKPSWLAETKEGLCYVSERDKFSCHVHCLSLVMQEAWKRGRGDLDRNGDDNDGISKPLEKVDLKLVATAKRSGGEGGGLFLGAVTIFLKTIIGILFGDPTDLIVSALTELVKELLTF